MALPIEQIKQHGKQLGHLLHKPHEGPTGTYKVDAISSIGRPETIFISDWEGIGQYVNCVHIKKNLFNHQIEEINIYINTCEVYNILPLKPLLWVAWGKSINILTPWQIASNPYGLRNILTDKQINFHHPRKINWKTLQIDTLRQPNDEPLIYLPENLILNCESCPCYNDFITTQICCRFKN